MLFCGDIVRWNANSFVRRIVVARKVVGKIRHATRIIHRRKTICRKNTAINYSQQYVYFLPTGPWGLWKGCGDWTTTGWWGWAGKPSGLTGEKVGKPAAWKGMMLTP